MVQLLYQLSLCARRRVNFFFKSVSNVTTNNVKFSKGNSVWWSVEIIISWSTLFYRIFASYVCVLKHKAGPEISTCSHCFMKEPRKRQRLCCHSFINTVLLTKSVIFTESSGVFLFGLFRAEQFYMLSWHFMLKSRLISYLQCRRKYLYCWLLNMAVPWNELQWQMFLS